MHSRSTACVVLIAACTLLAIPAQRAAQPDPAQQSIVAFAAEETSRTLPLVSFKATVTPASCTLPGRPCNPQHPTCCSGSRCVFRGGSTRVGYQCVLRTGSANVSTSPSRETLSVNELDRDALIEVPIGASSSAE
jgi:hypothetical protein